MNTNEPLEAKLERLSETVSLRADEKDLHRENLRIFMAKSRQPVRSPYVQFMRHGMRYATAFMLLLVVTGTGMVSAAEGSGPGDPLYVMKLKVTEPVRSAFIFDPEEKTEFEVERADRRLKEFALLSSSENPDPETTELIAASLSESIAEINQDVTELTAEGEADEALETNADLQSLLSAHQQILALVEERHPDLSEDFDEVSDSIDTSIANTENVEQAIEDSLESSVTEDQSVREQAEETQTSLLELRQQLQEDAAVLDASDQSIVTEAFSEIDEILSEARVAQTEGNNKEAYLLFTEADQRLNELKTLIEADRDLGIGIIDTDSGE